LDIFLLTVRRVTAGMAFAAESPALKFENPYKSPYKNSYKNPYTGDIAPASDVLERRWSGSSAKYSEDTEKGEKDDWDVGDVYAEKEKAEYEYAVKHEQGVIEQALLFQNITAPDAIRTLSFHHPGCKRKNLIINDDGGKTIYYADVSRWTGAPDIVLHNGETKDHPVAAIARFRCSRHLRLGVGDPADEPAMVWEEMKNTNKLAHSRYRLEVTNNEPGIPGQRRAVLFQRTRSKEDGVTNRLSCMNYKIVDEETGELLAMYLATGWKDWKKRATLHIKSGFLKGNAEVLVVLGMCGLIEKKWRRDNS
jgi:hypothetical protein